MRDLGRALWALGVLAASVPLPALAEEGSGAEGSGAEGSGAQEPVTQPTGGGAKQEAVGESLHMTMASGAPNQYFFRGLMQSDKGFIWQANSNLDVALYDSKKLRVITPVGFWFSVHPGDQAKKGRGPAAWYESRLSGGLALANDAFRADARLTVYSSPNGSFRDVYELTLTGDLYDDSLWTNGDARAFFRGFFPGLTLAHEVKGARDGVDPGTFLELRAAPRARLLSSADWVIDVAVPASVGLSLHDYYQITDPGTGKVRSHTLGYASAGLLLDVAPLFVPRRLGLYSIQPSLQMLLPTAAKHSAPNIDALELVAQIISVLRF